MMNAHHIPQRWGVQNFSVLLMFSLSASILRTLGQSETSTAGKKSTDFKSQIISKNYDGWDAFHKK